MHTSYLSLKKGAIHLIILAAFIVGIVVIASVKILAESPEKPRLFGGSGSVICEKHPSMPGCTIQDQDTDKDGFSDKVENYMGTDPSSACANNNNHAAWPPDFDNNRTVNILDITKLTPPTFNTSQGNDNYKNRYDLNADGTINILDTTIAQSYFNKNCNIPLPSPSIIPLPSPSTIPLPSPSIIPSPSPIAIPEAPPEITCNGNWDNIKELGNYANNAISSYNNRLILTTVTPSYEATPGGQKVVAREINPETNFDTNWYQTGFSNSQNSHVLIVQKYPTLYIYGNVGSNNNRTVFKGNYLGVKRWGNWINTGAKNLGRTGPYTTRLNNKIYRFTNIFQSGSATPKAVLQKCSSSS